MAYGYKAPWYFYWKTKGNGGKYIKNDKTNYFNGDYFSGNGAKLTGTSKADSIENAGDKVVINAGKGADNISNGGEWLYDEWHDGEWLDGGDSVTINAGDGADTIYNSYSDNVTINGGAGDDRITNDGGMKVFIDTGDDNDFVESWPTGSKKVTILGGAGNDSFMSWAPNSLLDGGKDNDSIRNWGTNVTILGGEKNDFVENFASKVSISGGNGNDTLSNDDYTGGGDSVTIDTGTGKDFVYNDGSHVSINATADKKGDYISNSGDSVTIDAGAGDDSIYNHGSNVTIDAGSGADTIHNYGRWDGSQYLSSNISINAGDGNNSISTSGEKVTILGGKDKDTIENSGSNVKINAGEGNNSISNSGEKVTISGGADNDTIENSGDNVSINGGDGNNLISLTGGKDISIKGGKDTETFIIEAYNNLTASIQSGEGKNIIQFLGSWEGYGGNFLSVSGGVNEVSSIQTTNNTLITGAGDDSVTIGSNSNSIVAGTYDISADGLDADYILINSGSDNTIDTGDGNDIVWIKDGATNNTIHTGHQGDSIRSEGAHNSINAGYGNDTIDNWGKFVTIQAGDQETTGGKNSVKNHVDNVTILGGNESDTITNYMGRGVSINGGAGKDVIKLYSMEAFGNILKATFQPLLNAVKDFNQTKINEIIDMYNTLAEYIDGFEKISRVEATYKGKNQIELRDDLKKISEKAGELDEALDEVEDSFKAVGFDTDAISLLKKSVGKVKKIAGKGIKLTDNTEIVTGMVNEYTDNKIWSTVAKEFASDFQRNEKGRLVFPQKKTLSEPTTVRGGKGNDKIYGDEKRFYVYEYKAGDGHDTIFNWNSNDTLSITGGSYTGKIVKGDYVVTVGKGSVTFKNYTSRSIQQVLVGDSFEKLPCQIEGQMLSGGSRNDWHEASGSYWQTVEPPPEGISVDRDELTVAKNFSGEINLSKDYATYVTKVDASNAAGNVEIIGSDSTERITAGKGNDNVHSNRSFTVIHSGAGKDIVSSSGDNNSINSGADNDIIVNLGDSFTVDSGAGNDSIISDGKKNLFIVADGGNKIIYGFGKTDTLQIVDDSGTYSQKKKGDDLIITADDGKITLSGAASLKSVNIEVSVTSGREIYNDESNAVLLGTNKADTFSNRGAGVSISALGGNDSINNHGDNVTISGGKGNDSVYSWGVGTAYVYSAGNDTLQNFDEDDTIVLGSVKVNSSVRADGTVTLNLSNKKTLTLTRYWSDKINTAKSIKDVKAINVVRNRDDSISIEGASGDDYIENSGSNVTISGGKGNDSVYSRGVGTAYVYSAGNDTLDGFDEDDTIVLGSVKINSSVRADGTVTLNLSNKKTLTLTNHWSDKINTVKAVKDVKAINIVRNYDSSVTVKGTSVADYIENNGNNVTVSALGGNDTVKSWKANVSIHGGAGDDYIENSGDNVTISGGKGNDFVESRGVGTAYVYSAGNDTLDGFNEDDTIVLGSVKVNSSVSADGTVTLNLSNKKTLTLTNHWSDKINTVKAVKDVKAINVVRSYDSSFSVEDSLADDYIENNGAGNDTLWGGGSGSSKIYGSEEVDTFIYRPGGDTDIICDYESGELLQILDADFSDSSFKNDKLTLTIDAVGRDSVIFGGVSKSDSFNINGSKLK